MGYDVLRTRDFGIWEESLSPKNVAIVRNRIFLIAEHGYFGDFKHLGDGLLELRWKNGIRVYFIKIDNKKILLLIGGHKNGQKKDIKKARNMY